MISNDVIRLGEKQNRFTPRETRWLIVLLSKFGCGRFSVPSVQLDAVADARRRRLPPPGRRLRAAPQHDAPGPGLQARLAGLPQRHHQRRRLVSAHRWRSGPSQPTIT